LHTVFRYKLIHTGMGGDLNYREGERGNKGV